MNRQPSLFISHGSPMMAVEKSKTSVFLSRLGKQLTKPDAVVVFSAHFDLADNIVITAGKNPETIHDFYGFPEELYSIRYPAPGSPELATDIAERFIQAGLNPVLDEQRGWDHGLWIPLRLMFPEATIPVVQISINSRLGAQRNFDYGQLLAPLRDNNVLIIGSGGISHNLRELFNPQPTPNRKEMVQAFTDWVSQKLGSGDTQALLNYMDDAPYVLFNHPTQEHFLPLIAAMGSGKNGSAKKIHQDTEYDILAMDAYLFA
ncbi:dioxygenase [Vibrio albus]|uniref:Dioxygenase n=1 Tax=Vibrio albus TaxID=2200953 RepID=A0A2U3B939_9VIBR|nr:class III extradiol ring-cleavage dioxygenase [Vibrio albus]PWI33310.1 dioxygenase [Vibrio albus]